MPENEYNRCERWEGALPALCGIPSRDVLPDGDSQLEISIFQMGIVSGNTLFNSAALPALLLLWSRRRTSTSPWSHIQLPPTPAAAWAAVNIVLCIPISIARGAAFGRRQRQARSG